MSVSNDEITWTKNIRFHETSYRLKQYAIKIQRLPNDLDASVIDVKNINQLEPKTRSINLRKYPPSYKQIWLKTKQNKHTKPNQWTYMRFLRLKSYTSITRSINKREKLNWRNKIGRRIEGLPTRTWRENSEERSSLKFTQEQAASFKQWDLSHIYSH